MQSFDDIIGLREFKSPAITRCLHWCNKGMRDSGSKAWFDSSIITRLNSLRSLLSLAPMQVVQIIWDFLRMNFSARSFKVLNSSSSSGMRRWPWSWNRKSCCNRLNLPFLSSRIWLWRARWSASEKIDSRTLEKIRATFNPASSRNKAILSVAILEGAQTKIASFDY